MDSRYFIMPIDSPRLAWEGLAMVGQLWGPDPQYAMRDTERLALTPADVLTYIAPNPTHPRVMIIRAANLGTLFIIGGTEGTLHIQQLLQGWLSPGSSNERSGVNPAFERAMFGIIDSLERDKFDPDGTVRIIGHSYGGAVGQCLADHLVNTEGNPLVDVASFGAPRPGNLDFQRRMSRVRHARWFASNDPCRFIPPRVREVPSVLYFAAPPLWRGMDTQVQTTTGIQIEPNGNITYTEGEPTRLHNATGSIISWCTDTHGFRSVEHDWHTYMQHLSIFLQSQVNPVKPSRPASPERTGEISVGEAEIFMGEAERDIAADPAINFRPGTTVSFSVIDSASKVRYKRKKQGSIWTVQLEGVIVAVGPGKKRAGRIARAMNKAAVVPA